MKKMFALLVLVLLVSAVASCGSDETKLSPPAFDNLTGTRWSQTDTVSSTNSCDAPVGFTDSFILNVLSQNGNSLSVYDETRASQADAVNATISGYKVSSSGPRALPSGFYCSNLTASYSLTLNDAGSSYSGTGTITCHDSPACSVPVNVSGTKIAP